MNIEGNAESARVTGLIPWTDYEFQVIASNILGSGEPSMPSHIVRTLQAGKLHIWGSLDSCSWTRCLHQNQLVRSCLSSFWHRFTMVPLARTDIVASCSWFVSSCHIPEDLCRTEIWCYIICVKWTHPTYFSFPSLWRRGSQRFSLHSTLCGPLQPQRHWKKGESDYWVAAAALAPPLHCSGARDTRPPPTQDRELNSKTTWNWKNDVESQNAI